MKTTPDRGIINDRKLYDLRIMAMRKWCIVIYVHKQYILCKRIIRCYTFFTPNLYCSYHIALLGLRFTRFECLLLAVCTEETVFMICEVQRENYCQAYHKRQSIFKIPIPNFFVI